MVCWPRLVSPPPAGSAPGRVKYPVRPPATAPAPRSPAPVSTPRRDGRAGPSGLAAPGAVSSTTGPPSRDAISGTHFGGHLRHGFGQGVHRGRELPAAGLGDLAVVHVAGAVVAGRGLVAGEQAFHRGVPLLDQRHRAG